MMRELSPYLLLSRKQKVKQWLKALRCRFAETAKPGFMIVGAQKCGTTSIQQILSQHARLFSARFKELHYFSNDYWYSPNRHHQYHSFFPLSAAREAIYFESTPMYLYHPDVARRLSEYNADLKFVIALRDPALRAFSAWKMYHFKFREGQLSFLHDPREFSVAIDEELTGDMKNFAPNVDHHAYVKRGLYEIQIARYLKYFSRDQIIVVNSDSLRANPELETSRLLSFLKVESQSLISKVANVGEYVEGDFEETFDRLRQFYQPYNQKLFNLLGESFDW